MERAIILTRFSFITLLINRFKWRKKSLIYFFDLYGKSHGLIICLLVRAVGREKLYALFTKIASCLKVNVKKIPHANEIKDYHSVQIASQVDIVTYIDDFYSSGKVKNDCIFPKKTLDKFCRDSLFLKELAHRSWHILENIRVLKALGYEDIILHVDKGEFPGRFLDQMAGRELIKVCYINNFLQILIFPFCAFFFILQMVNDGLKLFKTIKQHDCSGAKIAIELVDPKQVSQLATRPEFLLSHTNQSDRFLIYMRGCRKKLFDKNEFYLNYKVPIIFLNELPFFFADMMVAIKAYFYLLLKITRYRCSVYFIWSQLKDIRLFLEFSSFFRCYNIRLHVYNLLPNGRRVSVRLDSGLITGLCRQFNIGSVTYQSRVHYHIDYKIAYDAFDKYYVWGSCWKRYFEKRNFIKSFEIIGNVFLDGYCCHPAEVKNKLVVFLTDIEEKVPQHHDFYYVESFLVELIYAVQQCQHGICENNKIIDIKIKNFKHKFWLL